MTLAERRDERVRERYARLSITEIDDLLNLKLGDDPLRSEIVDRLIAAGANKEARMGIARDPMKLFTIEDVARAAKAERIKAEPAISLLKKRADALVGCLEGSEEEKELQEISDVLDGYEGT